MIGQMGRMGGGFWPGGNVSTSTVVVMTVESLSDESSKQRFLGGVASMSRAPATAAEPPEKRKMPVRNAS